MKRVVARESQIVGTYDDATLRALLNAGRLRLGDQYWDDATSSWRTLTDFIGVSAPVRRSGSVLRKMAALFLAAALGAAGTWWVMKDSGRVLGVLVQPVASLPPEGGTPTGLLSPIPEVPANPIVAPSAPAEKKLADPTLAILNVEVFEEEVAVTLQNNGADAVHGFDLRLKYFELPAEKLEFDKNEAAIASHDAESAVRAEKVKALDAIAEALGRNLKIVSADVITWTPDHIKALPTAEQWRAFGDVKLGEAGAALTTTATAFAAGASATDPAERNRALTEVLVALGHRTAEVRPLLEAAIKKVAESRDRLVVDQKSSEANLAELKTKQRDLEPRLDQLMSDAQKNSPRMEIVRVDAHLDVGLVQRFAVNRQRNAREGVAVELSRADEKAVALSAFGQ